MIELCELKSEGHVYYTFELIKLNAPYVIHLHTNRELCIELVNDDPECNRLLMSYRGGKFEYVKENGSDLVPKRILNAFHMFVAGRRMRQ